jgi:GNAT superfamily N-acetyltransferase
MSPDTFAHTDFALKDGRVAHLRPIRPDDASRLIALFHRLSDETIRYRFFIAKKDLLPSEAEYFANVDYRKRMAVVAECELNGSLELIGVARYDASKSSDPQRAEFAVVVEDQFQGQRLGKVLLDQLADAARANGIRYIAGDTLADNQNMLRFLRGCRYPVQFRRDGTEMGFVLDIAAQA